MKVCLHCRHQFAGPDWRCPACGYLPPQVDNHPAFAPELAEDNQGFDPEFFELLARLEPQNFWFRSRNRLLFWALRKYFPQARNFLEIGCGTGYVLSGIHREFPQLKLFGSEIFQQGLAFAEKRVPEATLFQMDARRIPFAQEFDVVGAFDMLEHIEDDEAVLREMFQASRPGGGIMLTVPQHRWLWSVVDDQSFHKRRYVRGELEHKVQQAGFTLRRSTSFVFFLTPFMLLSRIRRQWSKARYDPVAELKIGPAANMILEQAMNLERKAIEWGWSFPLGGSRLVVAGRKEG